MSFDFMKEFMMFEDEERFAGLCEKIEEAIRDVDGGCLLYTSDAADE